MFLVLDRIRLASQWSLHLIDHSSVFAASYEVGRTILPCIILLAAKAALLDVESVEGLYKTFAIYEKERSFLSYERLLMETTSHRKLGTYRKISSKAK